MQVLNTTAITSGYAGRDPQEGTSDGNVCKFSFKLQKIVKVLLLVLEEKKKISYVKLCKW